MLVVYPSHVQSQYKHVKSLIHQQQSIMEVDSAGVYPPNSLLYSSEADFFNHEGGEMCWPELNQATVNLPSIPTFESI